MPLLTLRNITFGFDEAPLLDGVDLVVERGQRICLIGRNGSGKSTLMRILDGRLKPDGGELALETGARVARLPQEVPGDLSGRVFDVVAAGLGEGGRLLSRYHDLTLRVAGPGGERHMDALHRVQHDLDLTGGWDAHRQVEIALSKTSLEADAEVSTLSSGWKRRVLLARCLAARPDLLLLDEPTNHLDIEAIEWTENLLSRWEGAFILVTHDRAFLRSVANRVVELDRGKLIGWSCDYDTYLRRKAEALDAEQREWDRFDRKLAQEEIWIRKGIQARRTRNEGRVRQLMEMRQQRQQRRERAGVVRMKAQEAARSGRLVARATSATFGYGGAPVVRGLTLDLMRGDRVGIAGPNGCGKTTLMKLLLGELTPVSGTIEHGVNLDVAYFDQLRGQIDDNKTAAQNISDAELIDVGGVRRPVVGYLQDFLFTPVRSRCRAGVLSGGERARLLLARLFARPSNVLALDEPTNDLDIETLELLEEQLANYSGTVLTVSHDRAFLNNVVTSILAFEGDGVFKEYVGGYDDWRRQSAPPEPSADRPAKITAKPQAQPPAPPDAGKPRRLTYKEKKELEALPERIDALEKQVADLHVAMADPDFYRHPPARIAETGARMQTLEATLSEAFARWEALEAMADEK